MKVLHVAPIKESASGVVTVLAQLLPRLSENNTNIVLLASNRNSVVPTLLSDNIETLSYNNYFGSRRYLKTIPRLTKQTEMLLKSIDIVHFHGVYNPSHIVLSRYLKTERIPYVVSSHGSLVRQAQAYHKYRKKVANIVFVKGFLRSASALHALSRTEQEGMVHMVRQANVFTIPNAAPQTYITRKYREPNRELHKQYDANRLLLYMGRIDVPHKGLDLLYQGVRLSKTLLEENNVKILLVGPSDSESDTDFLRMLSRSSVNHLIRYVGPKYGEEKLRYLEGADAFVHTSRNEGMPMAVLEALSLGRPCIVTPGTNMGDVVSTSRGGWEANADPESIAQVLNQFASVSEQDLITRGKNAKLYVSVKMCWKTIAEQYRDMYSSILTSLS